MPIYEYQCNDCEHAFETIQKISEDPLTQCPNCNKNALRKKVAAAGFRLKGGGWYETDFKGDKRKNVSGSDSSDNSGSKEGSSSGKSDSSGGGGDNGSSSKASKSDSGSSNSGSGTSSSGSASKSGGSGGKSSS